MGVNVQCPFCFETFSIQVHAEDGSEQSFVYDCEVCCNPIDITVTVSENENGEPEFSVSSEKSN
jgi:hypothetical protein